MLDKKKCLMAFFVHTFRLRYDETINQTYNLYTNTIYIQRKNIGAPKMIFPYKVIALNLLCFIFVINPSLHP